MNKYALIASAIALAVVSTTSAVTVNVDSSRLFNQTGIQATGGEEFSITASGTVNISKFNGSYETDPNGVITKAPPVGSGAYFFFTSFAGPVGTPPAVGNTKSIILPFSNAQLLGAPYGALVAGFSLSPSPVSVSDFPNGFQLVGSSATITAPPGGGFLFLGVNDVNNTSDNVGSFTAQVASSSIQLLDPALELFAGTGSSITTDLNVLATKGRPITGVAADGVAEVVIRISGLEQGQQINVSLLDEDGALAPTNGEDGTLSNLIGGTAAGPTLVSPAVQGVNGGFEAFVLYQSPIDFVRGSGFFTDNVHSVRHLGIQITDSNNNVLAPVTDLQVVRPPVFFVHGLWGKPTAWEQFDPALTSAIPGLKTYRADYAKTNGEGVAVNLPKVFQQAEYAMTSFRTEQHVAAAQFDFIVHSMGGLISHTLGANPGYRIPATYGKGLIHKLITIDTPYQGSQLATNLAQAIQITPSCKTWLEKTGNVPGSAITDLTPGSVFLQGFDPSPKGYYKHAIASIADDAELQKAESKVDVSLELGIVGVPYSANAATFLSRPQLLCPFPSFSTFIHRVTLTSERMTSSSPSGANSGLYTPGSTAHVTNGLTHSNITVPLLGTAFPGAMDAGIGTPKPNPDVAVELLNSSVKSTTENSFVP